MLLTLEWMAGSKSGCKSLQVLLVAECSLSFLMDPQDIKPRIYHLVVNERAVVFQGVSA